MSLRDVLRLVVLAGAVLVIGCGNTSAGADARSPEVGATEVVGEVRESAGLDLGLSEPAAEVVGEVCETIIALDYFCDYTSACSVGEPGLVAWEEGVTWPCTVGADCRGGTRDCDEGQVCAWPDAAPTDFMGGDSTLVRATATCVPRDQVCGGPEALACPPGEFCELAGMICRIHEWAEPVGRICLGESGGLNCYYASAGGYGTCQPQPTADSCPTNGSGVCGCDGTTYANDCLRKAAGVPLDYLHACF